MSEQPKPIVGVPQEHKPFPQHNDGERECGTCGSGSVGMCQSQGPAFYHVHGHFNRDAWPDHICCPDSFHFRSQHNDGERYPYEEGDVIVLGPEIFAAKDGSVICWKDTNYTPQSRDALAEAVRELAAKWRDESYADSLYDESPDPWVLAERHAAALLALLSTPEKGKG